MPAKRRRPAPGDRPRLEARLLALRAEAKRAGWAEWIKSEADERAMLDRKVRARFSKARAKHACDFFPAFLRHSKGEWAGRPFELLDWQREEVISPLFGWIDENKRRRYQKCYIELPKKNGKSTLSAGVGLYMLASDQEGGAEVYSAGADRENASIVHGEAVNMIRSSPELSRVLKVHGNTKTIYHQASNSLYRALSKRPAGKEGLNAHAIICDELHVWQGRELWDCLLYATRARSQPLLWVITTAGADLESICYEQHEYALSIQNGVNVAHDFFPYVKCATATEDHSSKEVWKRCNPSLGVTFSVEALEKDYEAARKTPGALASWKRYTLNVWSGGVNPWLPAGAWERCEQAYTLDDLAGADCYGGLDLSKSDDTSSLVLAFPDSVDRERVWLQPFFWLPEGGFQKRLEKFPFLRKWMEEGYLELTPGEVCDYAFIRARLGRLRARFRLKQTGFDPWNALSLMNDLQDLEGFEASELVQFGQNLKNFAEPTAEMERRIIGETCHHPGNPVLSWQYGNAHIKRDPNGNMRPVKPPKADGRKIDGVVASIMALGLLLRDTPERAGGPYEKSDLKEV